MPNVRETIESNAPRVRAVEEDDWPDVELVARTAFDSIRHIYRPTDEAAQRQASRFREGDRLVALLEDRIVGTVQLSYGMDYVFVCGLAVHPEFHRQGVAACILQSVYEQAAKQGLAWVRLETVEQTGNVAIFERLGFEVVSHGVPTWCVSDKYDPLTNVCMRRAVVR